MTQLDPAVRDLLLAVRAVLYAPYLTDHQTPETVIAVRSTLAAVALDGASPALATDRLLAEFAEAADAGRCRFADRCELSRQYLQEIAP